MQARETRLLRFRLQRAAAALVRGLGARSLRLLRLAPFFQLFALSPEPARAADSPSPLGEIRQIRQLPPEQLARTNKAVVEGVITYHNPRRQLTFLQDETGGIQLLPSPSNLNLRAGDRVRVVGEVSDQGAGRILNPQETLRLGSDVLPKAPKTDARELLSGSLEGQWSEAHGIVRRAIATNGELQLRIALRSGEILARVARLPSPSLEDFVDGVITIGGVPHLEAGTENIAGTVQLLVSDWTQATEWQPAEPDPFQLPIQSIANIAQIAEKASPPYPRVRFRGQVTAVFGGDSIFVHEGSANIHVVVSNKPPEGIHVGDLVDAAGVPQFDPPPREIREAVVRVNRSSDYPAIAPDSLELLLPPAREGALVKVFGQLVWKAPQGDSILLLMEDNDGNYFQALLPRARDSENMRLPKRALFELTGICTGGQGNPNRGASFQLLLRDAMDIKLVRRESWLSLQNTNLLLILGAMTLLTAGAAAWVITLRRTVRLQTGQILHRLEREAALENRFSQLVENAPDLILTYGLSGHIRSINRAGEQLTGYTREEVLGRHIESLLISSNGLAELLPGPSKSSPSAGTELMLLTRFGERIPMEARWQPIITSGQPMEMQCIARDIRERKRAQEALRRSEEHLRLAIDAAQMGTWEFHPESGQVHWNTWVLEQYGMDGESFDGTMQSVLAHVHPLDRAHLERTVEVASRTGEPFQVEYRILRPDGECRWRLVQGHGLRESSGKVLRVLGVSQDITARKQAEQALREREEIYRAMFEKNRAVKLLVDPESGELVDANPAAAGFYGFTLDELRRMSLCDLGTLPRHQTLDLLRRAQAGENDLFHLRHILSDGTERDVEVYAGLLLVGGRSLLFCIVLDVSEQVRATESMQRLNEQLESRVNERTEELQKRIAEVEDLNANMIALLEDLKSAHLEAAESAQQSEVANLQLQSINQELEAFSYSVSHDLRAPLRHITGYVSILEESHGPELDEEGRRHLKTIHTAATRMSELIDDLLDFSRLGRAQLSLRPVNLGALAREIARELRPEAEGRDVVWRVHNLPDAMADPSLIRLVIQNLLENALKYTRPRSTAVIEFGAVSERGEGGEQTFFVRDNGVGFDMAYSNKLFGVFQRLHSANQFEGTGIGLANVRRIIVRHGGRTWAEAVPDQGATFFFTLPKRAPKREPDRDTHSMGA